MPQTRFAGGTFEEQQRDPVMQLVASGTYRDIPGGLVQRYVSGQATQEETIAAITGTPVFNPTIGPQVDYGQGKQPFTGTFTPPVAQIDYGKQPITSSIFAPTSDLSKQITYPTPSPIPTVYDQNTGTQIDYAVRRGETTEAYNARIAASRGMATPAEEPIQKTPEESRVQALIERLQGLNVKSVGEAQFRAGQEQTAGIPGLEATQRDLASQLSTLQAEARAIPLQLEAGAEGRGITTTILGRQEQALLRQNAIKALTISAALDATNGILASARDKVDRAVNAEFEPIEKEIEALTANINLILKSPNYTLQEKRRAEQQDALLMQRKEALADAKDEKKEIYDTYLKAAENGAGSVVLNKIRNAKTKFEAIELAGKYMRKPTTGTSDNETVQGYAQLLAEGKISVANVPQGIRNAVIKASGGIVNKPLSDIAIKEIQQSQSAISNLNALKTIVEGNLQYVGPISGLARFNPYSRARQVQSDIDRVRQQVGKTLEGGVLRKEDEEKYKKILATLADTPETAIYKIESLISSITRDVGLYKDLQQETGRFVPGGETSTLEELRTKYNY